MRWVAIVGPIFDGNRCVVGGVVPQFDHQACADTITTNNIAVHNDG
jgi:hypothetical protein